MLFLNFSFQGYFIFWFKNLYMNFLTSFIHNCSKLEVTKRSLNKQTDKLWYIHIMGYYLAIIRNELSGHEKKWSRLKCILLSKWIRLTEWMYQRVKKPVWKTYKLHDPNFMIFWERQNYETVKILVVTKSHSGDG